MLLWISKIGTFIQSIGLPSAPDFSDNLDESAALTRLRAMTELLTGRRYTIASLICDIIENAGKI